MKWSSLRNLSESGQHDTMLYDLHRFGIVWCYRSQSFKPKAEEEKDGWRLGLEEEFGEPPTFEQTQETYLYWVEKFELA